LPGQGADGTLPRPELEGADARRERREGGIPDPMELVVGLTGPNAAGKGEVAAYLATLGFTVHSLSDVVREEAAERGLSPEREHLIRIGVELRRACGPGVLAERILPRLVPPAVVDSIRHPAEVEVLSRIPGFLLLGIRASEETRFHRSVARRRPGDPSTMEDFRRREAQENSASREGQQLDVTFQLAHVVVDNDGDLEQLRRGVDLALAGLGS
jgi:dephospho-CoA kinase